MHFFPSKSHDRPLQEMNTLSYYCALVALVTVSGGGWVGGGGGDVRALFTGKTKISNNYRWLGRVST